MKLGTEEKPKKAKAAKGVDMLDLMDEAAARLGLNFKRN